jgi:hypothetical protein
MDPDRDAAEGAPTRQQLIKDRIQVLIKEEVP